MLRRIKTAVAGFTLAASMALAAPMAFAQDVIIIIICDATECVIIIIQN